MEKEIKFEFGVRYPSGEGLQAYGALKPMRDILFDLTDGVYTTAQVEEHLPWRLEEEGRRCRRVDIYYGVTDSDGATKLREIFMGMDTSKYEVFLNID